MNPTYRKGANAIVVDSENNFLIVQRTIYDIHQWDFPGGGIKENEIPEQTIIRELLEEFGTDKFNIITLSKHKIKFDWPQDIIEGYLRDKGKHYLGQEKYQFLVKFTGNKKDIVIDTTELAKIKWVKYKDLKQHLIFAGQWENAELVIKDFVENKFISI